MVLLCMFVLTGCGSSGDSGSKKDDVKVANNIVIRDKYVVSVKDEKYGLIDKKGKQILNNTYDYLGYSPAEDSYFAKVDHLNGIIDKDGKEIIPIKYDYLFANFNGDKYGASDSKKSYVLDTKGNIEKTYNYGLMYYLNEHIFIVGNEVTRDEGGYLIAKNYGLIDKDEKVLLKCEYDKLSSVLEYNNEKERYEPIALYAEKDGKAGVFDFKGKVIVPMEYHIATGEEMKMYYVTYNGNTQSYLVYKNDLYGVLNKDGSTLIDTKYDRIQSDSSGYLVRKDGETTYFDLDGKEIIKVDGGQYNNFSENGFVAIQDEDAKWKYIDKKGKEKEFKALKGKDIQHLESFDKYGNATVNLNEGGSLFVALMNDKGKFVIEPIQGDEYDIRSLGEDNEDFYTYHSNSFSEDDTFGSTDYVLEKDKKIMKSDTEYMRITESSMLYDKNGKKLGECEGRLYPVSNEYYKIQKPSITEDFDYGPASYGLMNRSGKVVAKPIYDDIRIYDDYIKAEKDGNMYLLDLKSGKEILKY